MSLAIDTLIYTILCTCLAKAHDHGILPLDSTLCESDSCCSIIPTRQIPTGVYLNPAPAPFDISSRFSGVAFGSGMHERNSLSLAECCRRLRIGMDFGSPSASSVGMLGVLGRGASVGDRAWL